jgi:hypothetical protein
MGIKEKPKQQLINEQEEISPLSILIGLFILSLFSFLIVDLLPTIFYRALDASSYLAFHNFTEIFSIIVLFSIAGVGWYTYDQSRNRHTLFLSCAFIAVGLLDPMHTLSYPGMPVLVTPSSNIKSQQFWLAARMVTTIAFLASVFIYPNTQNRLLSRKVLLPAAKRPYSVLQQEIKERKRIEETLKETRGVVMSIAKLNFSDKMMAWPGVGNIEVLLQREDGKPKISRERLLLRGGALGYQLPPLRESVIPFIPLVIP